MKSFNKDHFQNLSMVTNISLYGKINASKL